MNLEIFENIPCTISFNIFVNRCCVQKKSKPSPQRLKEKEGRRVLLELGHRIEHPHKQQKMGKEGDLWDDSALINAFDAAISKYKVLSLSLSLYITYSILLHWFCFASSVYELVQILCLFYSWYKLGWGITSLGYT